MKDIKRKREAREREAREREARERERERERAQTTTHNNVGEFKNNIQTKYISKSFPKTQQIKFSSLRELNSKLKKIIRRIENKN